MGQERLCLSGEATLFGRSPVRWGSFVTGDKGSAEASAVGMNRAGSVETITRAREQGSSFLKRKVWERIYVFKKP